MPSVARLICLLLPAVEMKRPVVAGDGLRDDQTSRHAGRCGRPPGPG